MKKKMYVRWKRSRKKSKMIRSRFRKYLTSKSS